MKNKIENNEESVHRRFLERDRSRLLFLVFL